MARKVIVNDNDHEVAYGLDRVPYPGYYVQVFDGEDNVLVNLDTRSAMTGEHASKNDVAEAMREHGAPDQDVQRVLADLPIQ